MPRFYCPIALANGSSLELPPGTAKHVQVLRLQPGAGITLFNGEGGEFEAVIERMGGH
jgi:16S rRNA (uracil1498-N3)-methyltransferase